MRFAHWHLKNSLKLSLGFLRFRCRSFSFCGCGSGAAASTTCAFLRIASARASRIFVSASLRAFALASLD